MTDRGTIGEIERLSPALVRWKMKNLASLSETVGDFYWSPEIRHFGVTWKLCIYPNGTHSITEWTMLEVWKTNVTDVKPLRFSLGILNNDGSEEKFIRSETFYSDTRVCSGLLKFIRRDILLKNWTELSFNGKFHITFRIWIDEPTSKEGREIVSSETKGTELAATSAGQEDCAIYDPKDDDNGLRQHLENMLLAGEDHDVTIQVKDKQFRAHKDMLRTRSPVFAAMFKHQMKESADGSISIEDCDPESFGEFLRYVYTGRVKNLSPSNAMGLYYTGDKYDFSGLKKLCVEFLTASLSTAVIGDVISLAVKHSEDELLDCAMTFFSKHLEEIMSSVEWQRFLLDDPIRANEICLKAMKCRLRKN